MIGCHCLYTVTCKDVEIACERFPGTEHWPVHPADSTCQPDPLRLFRFRVLLTRYPVFDGFTCPRCGLTGYHPDDIREGYCGRCHDWTRP